MNPPFLPSSVTRWLPVVVGCAVLETAQPMNAAQETPSPVESAVVAPAPAPAPAPAVASSPGLDPDLVLHPAGSRPAEGSSAPAPGGAGSVWIFVGLVGLAAGAFWLWRRRAASAGGLRGGPGIVVEHTRALGNRQFLVVAGVDGRRFLLGVAPGNIRLLSPLDSADGSPPEDDDAS